MTIFGIKIMFFEYNYILAFKIFYNLTNLPKLDLYFFNFNLLNLIKDFKF